MTGFLASSKAPGFMQSHGYSLDLKVPFHRSYWVIPGKFLAGCYPGSKYRDEADQKLTALLGCGIRHVVNLMEPDERDWNGLPFVPYEDQLESIAGSMGHTVTFDRLAIKDTWVRSRKTMCRILDRIDQCIRNQKHVYIHCLGGRGRTGTVVGCFLARHGMASGHNLPDRIQELRRNAEDHDFASPESMQQVELVLSWVEAE
ncbi:MAG: dual specificity protein phosphatase family protein [Desulfobacterales bacterium]|nr:MAG: dual specificity protein phosphatase family protein [Desulfobacterales bacterium]